MAAKLFAFSANNRIKKRAEILVVQESGRKLYSKDFIVILKARESDCSRLAVTVSKRVHKRAVRRNRVKRRLRELFRLNQNRLNGCFDILIIARKNAADIDYAEMKRQILGALHHHGYFSKKT